MLLRPILCRRLCPGAALPSAAARFAPSVSSAATKNNIEPWHREAGALLKNGVNSGVPRFSSFNRFLHLSTHNRTPVEPQVVSHVAEVLSEPTFKSLGLAGFWPSGWLQGMMETLHLDFGMPWWATILTQGYISHLSYPATVLVRITVTPSAIRTYHSSKIFRQDSFNLRRDAFGSAISISIFAITVYAIGGMVWVPVESMQLGGFFWFTDLTQRDPYFMLPAMSTTLLIARSMITLRIWKKFDPTFPYLPVMKMLGTGILISAPFVCMVPAALSLYFVLTNSLAIGQFSLIHGYNEVLGGNVTPKKKPPAPRSVENPKLLSKTTELEKSLRRQIQQKQKNN